MSRCKKGIVPDQGGLVGLQIDFIEYEQNE